MRLIDADALKEDLTRFYDGEVTARDLIDEQPTVGGWISVKDRLPKTNEMVLVLVKSKEYVNYHVIAMLMQDGDWDSNDDYFCMSDDEIIYWMPLPEPPEEDDGK